MNRKDIHRSVCRLYFRLAFIIINIILIMFCHDCKIDQCERRKHYIMCFIIIIIIIIIIIPDLCCMDWPGSNIGYSQI